MNALLALMIAFAAALLPDEPPMILAGDEAFQRLDYSAAVAAYNSALEELPDDPEVLWRLARVRVCQGELEDEPERLRMLREAEAHARHCLANAPDHEQGHTWLAGALGLLALEAGMKDQLRMVEEIEESTHRALARNPRNDVALGIRGSLYRALGSAGWLKRGLAGLFVGPVPDGGYEEAEANLREAAALAPRIMRHRYELGVLYLDWGRHNDARRAFQEALRCPVTTAGDRARLKKCELFLKEIE